MYYIYSLLAVVWYALTQVIAKKVQIAWNVSPLLFISVTMLVLLPLALVSTFIFEKTDLSSITQSEWGWMILCWVINLVAFILLVTAIKYIPVAHYQIISLLMPIIWWTIAYFWFWEKLSSHFFIWFALMSLWLIIALWTFTTK